MGVLVERALDDALRALACWDTALACQIIAGDQRIDQSRTEIEDSVLDVLSTQQPVLGFDLRRLNGGFLIASELERIGDYSKSIARKVCRCVQAPALLIPPPALQRMGTIGQMMLHTSLDAFTRLDVQLAQSLADEDDQVDVLRDQLTADLLLMARQNPQQIDCAITLVEVARALERLADRSTNIAERVIFIVTNTAPQLNA